MTPVSTRAVLLKRIGINESDIILTVFTVDAGKISIIAKYAKNSKKRFIGKLELFSLLDVVYKPGKSMHVLQEVSLCNPFINIRGDVAKTTYASYWNELVCICMLEGEVNLEIYQLLIYILSKVDMGKTSLKLCSIIFQMRFISIIGLMPNLYFCSMCKTNLKSSSLSEIFIDPSGKGVCCNACIRASTNKKERQSISRGTLRQLDWATSGDLRNAFKVRFSSSGFFEGLLFLESFISRQIGRLPKSLVVLQNLRKNLISY